MTVVALALMLTRMNDWLAVGTHVMAFVAGVASKVFADTLTDRRRAREERGRGAREFAQAEAAMPALIEEMRADLAGDSLVREFVVLSSRGVGFTHSAKRFEYYESEHPDLRGKIAMLENLGYVRDVRVYQQWPIYRMTEEFIRRLTGEER